MTNGDEIEDAARVIIEFADGSTAIWTCDESEADDIAKSVESRIGQPDTLH